MSPPPDRRVCEINPKDDIPSLEVLFQDYQKRKEAQEKADRESGADFVREKLFLKMAEAFGMLPLGQAATLQLMHPIDLAKAGFSQAEQYQYYKAMVEVRGYTLDPNTPTVVAMRGVGIGGDHHETISSTKYDDTMVVLSNDAQGMHVTTFAGSTHPAQKEGAIGGAVGIKDADKDGTADVGMINPGEYRVVPHAMNGGNHNGANAWDVQTVGGSGNLPGVRDTNHDGHFSKAEKDASAGRGDYLDGVMIHRGAENQPQSAGCLNLSSKDSVYPPFTTAAGGKNQSMKLIILDGSTPAP